MLRIYSQPNEDVALAKRVLSWISCAKRPLTVLEIQHALAVEPGIMNIDEEALIEEDLLVSVCLGLVTIEEESSIIRLVHFTTQEYFQRTRIDYFPTAETDIAMSCLTYLSFSGYAELLFSHHRTELRDQYPLLPYVATYWATHTRGEPEENPQVQRLALQLLENKYTVTVVQGAQEFARGWGPNSSYDVLGLLIAASSNLMTITTLLLDRGARIEDANPRSCETVLHSAAEHSHGAMVKLLLERGAQIDAPTSYQQTALMLAATSGHEPVVQVLLEHGAAIEAETCQKETPLNLAAICHKPAVMALLLESGADINTKDCHGKAPVNRAVAGEDGTDMMQLLLEHGADITTRDNYNRTLLGQAVSSSSSTMVRLLLEAGADINARDGRSNGTVLFTPVFLGKTDTVQLLLDSGIDIHIRNDYGETALFYGSPIENGTTARLLVEAGADVNARDRDGRTALFAAARRGAAAVVQLLLNAGADVNTKDNAGRTALLMAAKRGAAAVVQLLLTEGADLHTKHNHGKTILHAVVCEDWNACTEDDDQEKSYDTVVQLLLEAGADCNARDDLRMTALHSAAERGYTGAVQLLLHDGADFELKALDVENALFITTPLEVAVSKQHWDVVEILSKAKERQTQKGEGLDVNYDCTSTEDLVPSEVHSSNDKEARTV